MVTKQDEYKPFFLEKDSNQQPKGEPTNSNVGELNQAPAVPMIKEILGAYDSQNFMSREEAISLGHDEFVKWVARKKSNAADSPLTATARVLFANKGINNPEKTHVVEFVDKLREAVQNWDIKNNLGKNDPERYYVSLRPKFEGYGIKAKQQDKKDRDSCCELFAMASLLEYQLAKSGNPQTVSIPFLKWVHDTMATKHGMKIINGGRSKEPLIEGINTYGVLSNDVMPMSMLHMDPTSTMIAKSNPIKIMVTKCGIVPELSQSSDYSATKNFQDIAIKDELKKGNPILVGELIPCSSYISFMNGFPKGCKGAQHAFLIVGFYTPTGNDEDTVYEVLNSWGTDWGNQGYGWITSKLLNQNDVTSITLD